MSKNTEIFGVIGDGIDYSLSPAIYRALFAWKGVDAVYNVFNLKGGDLEPFTRAVRLLGMRGFNVTTPYKQRMLRHIDKADQLVRKTRSLNLVINRSGLLSGHNTDYEGIKRSIETALKCDVTGANVAVIGSGGSAHTVYYYLIRHRAGQITVYHHSKASFLRFGAFARGLRGFARYRPIVITGKIGDQNRYDLCVNCTPAPVAGLLTATTLEESKMIFELRYGDYPLLKRTHLRGNYMLAVQAAASFRIMTGSEVSVSRITRIVDEALLRD